ncbi:MAG: hypothetical protein BWK76_11980 [Desulfobulbaceae bacterium A2]|nr:MAG: hypothetical protein BWK76_11980 [Desulfobulbaceae bacterium A2]
MRVKLLWAMAWMPACAGMTTEEPIEAPHRPAAPQGLGFEKGMDGLAVTTNRYTQSLPPAKAWAVFIITNKNTHDLR